MQISSMSSFAKKAFLELGIAFAQFSAKPDREKYKDACRIALSLELELPDYDVLKDRLWWDFVPPMEWFTGSNGGSFKNCYEIGKLAYLLKCHRLFRPKISKVKTSFVFEIR